MTLRAQIEGLAIPATIVPANVPKDTLVAITGNRTVNVAGADAHAIGRVTVPSRTANGRGTIETRYKELVEIKNHSGGAVAAGTLVKLAAVDGVTGENVARPWVSGTDGWASLYGIVWNGAAANGTLEVLTF